MWRLGDYNIQLQNDSEIIFMTLCHQDEEDTLYDEYRESIYLSLVNIAHAELVTFSYFLLIQPILNHQTCDKSHTLVGNKIADNSDVVLEKYLENL